MNKLLVPLAVVWLLLDVPLAAQSPEAPAEINVLTYTNSNYHHHDGYQQWIYSPTESRTGGGYLRTHDIARFHRYGGGYHSNFWANHSFAVGEDPYEYYHEYRNATAWFGPLPTTAVWSSYSTNYWWWPWMANAETSAYSDGGVHTNYWWSPPESRNAFYSEDVPNWTLIFHWGEPHQGYFEKWTNGTTVSTTLELFSGGASNSTADVTIQLNVWAYDNLRRRWLTGNEITVTVGGVPGAGNPFVPFGGGTELAPTPDASDNVYFLAQDNQRAQVSFSFHPTNALPTNLPPGAVEDVSFWAYPARHHLLVGVDKNRDGSIELDGTNDLTSATAPYVFWVNNDNDKLGNPFSGESEVDWFDAETSGSAAFANDYAWNFVHTERDLEDYTRVDIRLPALDLGTNWSVRLSFSGKLKFLFSPCTGFEYLTDQNLASLLTYTNPASWFVGATDDGPVTLTPACFNAGTCRLLVKAGNTASGALLVELLKDGSLLARNRLHLDLRDIANLYEHYTVGNAMLPGVDATLLPATTPSGPTGGHFADENGKYLLFVHGWNMPYHEKRFFAETALKRLYWQGYKGRFGLFTWPTFYFNNFLLHDGIINYDRSEHNAWRSGQPLLNLLQQLDAQFPGQVRLIAHSMGNIPAGEALRLAGTNHVAYGYVAMQAALSAHCYDGRPEVEPIGPGGFSAWVFDRALTTANCYAEYPANGSLPYLTNSAGAGTYHSFLNPVDYALVGLWDLNQRQKPDGFTLGYHYSAPSGANVSGFYRIQTPATFYLGFPHDTHEIFSFAAESRSVALGASQAVEGVFARDRAVKLDLNGDQGYNDEHRFHSGQFLSTIAQRWLFWQAICHNLDLND